MNTDTCGCCEGTEVITPIPIVNRPGLSALDYRVGSHATFLETMLARLSALGIPLKELGTPLSATDDPESLIYPLRGLTTRSTDDPAIAFLDAWGIVTDILTFYQERIANEGYLPTATERRSILQLARLVGYKLRPGVSASVFLAYTLENGHDTTIPAGSRVQSLPGPGQLPQSFETSVDLVARSKWNNLQPRMSVPQYITRVRLPYRITFIDMDTPDGSIYLAGTGTNLKPNDPVLFVFGDELRDSSSNWTGEQVFGHVQKVTPNTAAKLTTIAFPMTFTPLVFIRSAVQFIEQYRDLAAFGVSPDDPGVSDVVTPLALLKDILEMLESYIAVAVANPALVDPFSRNTAALSDITISLFLMGLMLVLVDHYDDLELSLFSPGTTTIKQVLDVLTLLDTILQLVEHYLELIRSGLLTTDKQVQDVIAQLEAQQNAITALEKNLTDSLLQSSLQATSSILSTFLSAIVKAPPTDPAISSVISDLQDVQQTLQGFLLKASTTPSGTKNTAVVVSLKDVEQTLLGLLSLSSSEQLAATLSGGQTFNIIATRLTRMLGNVQATIGIFSTWCKVYNDAVQSGSTQLANWIGGLINDAKSLIGTLPGGRAIVKNVCTPVVTTSQASLVSPLAKPTLLQPANSVRLRRDPNQIFARKGDIATQLLAALRPEVGSTLYAALSNADATSQPSLQNLYALRAKAAPFGSNAPLRSKTQNSDGTITTEEGEEWQLKNIPDHSVLDLDARYDQILPGSWVVLEYTLLSSTPFPWKLQEVYKVLDVQTVSRADYGMSAKVTRLFLDRDWLLGSATYLSAIRGITIYAQSEELALADEPLTDDIGGQDVELDDLYDGLQSGRWAIVSGERTDIPHTSGIIASELVMLAGVKQDVRPLNTPAIPAMPAGTQGGMPTAQLKPPPGDSAPRVQAPPAPAIPSTPAQEAQPTATSAAQPEQQTKQAAPTPPAKSAKVEAPASQSEQATPEPATAPEGAASEAETAAPETPAAASQSSTPTTGAEAQNQQQASTANAAPDIGAAVRPDETASAGQSTPPPDAKASILKRFDDTPPPDTVPPTTLPGDKTHTFLHFAQPLAYTYKRDTVKIAGNVVHATHGETQNGVLGSGDGSKSMQRFTLRKSPLTYLSAATPSGADTTLAVRVNDILWHETDNMDAAGPTNRTYITQADDQDKTTVVFGNGMHGARLPTGAENVKTVYRVGIGKPGNVDAGQISLLATRPLGVKGVNNPLPATGGADKESRDQARRNVPLATLSLDRIVSTQDYADFARTFAGIGKASAVNLPLGRQQLVHLTIAGLDNIPITKVSDLYLNLFQALRQFGNPSTPLRVDIAEVKLLVISAQVRVLPDYQLESVAPNIRTALYNAFGFEQRDLGQPVYQSEVLSVIQGVAGVAYVDLAILAAVDQQALLDALNTIHVEELQEANTGQQPDPTHDLENLLGLGVLQYVTSELARADPNADGGVDPAQLVFLSADVPDTLILTELN